VKLHASFNSLPIVYPGKTTDVHFILQLFALILSEKFPCLAGLFEKPFMDLAPRQIALHHIQLKPWESKIRSLG